MSTQVRMSLAIVGASLLGACASAPPSNEAPLTQREAHVICYQRMQAARAGSLNTTPNRHQYIQCMKSKGFNV